MSAALGPGLRGGLMVCGTSSDAGKSFVVAGLCRLLGRRGVRVAPFKAQNMALNATVTADGAEIGHAQWVQAVAAGVAAEAAMNPILLKPTSDRASQVVVMGRPTGVRSAAEYHGDKPGLRPVVAAARASGRFTRSPSSRLISAGLPAVVVGDIDRGGVFAALYGTVALLPDDLRACVRGFVVNRLRGDPALLGGACADLEARCGVPTLGVLPHVGVVDIDNEDSLALDRPDPPPAGDGDVVDVAALRWPRVSNAGDLDPLRAEPGVHVRWVRSVAELGRPDLVVLPGSKNTRGDLDWFRRTGLAAAVERSAAPVVAVCAGLQMAGGRIDDPDGAADEWLMSTEGSAGGEVLGWRTDRLAGTTVHGLFESDGFRAAVLADAAARAGKRWTPAGVDFAATRLDRLDRIADTLEAHLDLDRVAALIAEAAP